MKAEEFLRNAKQDANSRWTAKKMLIEFAKYHVEQALKAASEEAEAYHHPINIEWVPVVDKNSITNSYPIENII